MIRLKMRADQWFPDRQLLIRGPGKLVAISVSQRRQVVLSLALVLGVVTLTVTSCGMVVSLGRIGEAFATRAQLAGALAQARAQAAGLAAENARMRAATNDAVARAVAQRNAAIASAGRIAAAARAQAAQATATATAQEDSLQAQTAAQILQVERLIRSTGLNPASLAGATPARPRADTRIAALRQNLAYLAALSGALARVPLSAPLASMQITSPFGYRASPFTGRREFHVGIDLRGAIGTPVYATAPGRVIFAGFETGYGRLIVIDHGMGLTTRYSHLASATVRVGDRVALHQNIGAMGNTGWSTGPHLLYETRYEDEPFNPLQFIKVSFNDVQK
jgi:murein DD-endopeptidase MepM/ murein hydrolase activator NlpD